MRNEILMIFQNMSSEYQYFNISCQDIREQESRSRSINQATKSYTSRWSLLELFKICKYLQGVS